MKEEQKSELLKNIREKAQEGLALVNERLESTTDEVVEVGGAIVERATLTEFKETLEKVGTVRTIKKLKVLLKEDVIPFDMFMANEYWEELQRLIFQLHGNEDLEECER